MIPCYNEEKTLPLVLNSIPKKIKGIDKIETLIVDDGCTDKTAEVAKKLGVNYIVKHNGNKGLARAFVSGLEESLKRGADIIVNTDGDNQYPQKDIPKLIRPILSREAEIVVANRQTSQIKHFSFLKKLLQSWGSWVVRLASGTKIPDAVSGYRAYSKDAAMQINVVTEFSYVIETIIQASKKKISIAHINIKTNPKTRESRLFKNIWQHVKKSGTTIIRVFAMYEPLKTFSLMSLLLITPGVLIGFRFLYFFFKYNASGNVQSLILSAILLIIGFQIFLIGLVADLIADNRKLIEDFIYKEKIKSYN